MLQNLSPLEVRLAFFPSSARTLILLLSFLFATHRHSSSYSYSSSSSRKRSRSRSRSPRQAFDRWSKNRTQYQGQRRGRSPPDRRRDRSYDRGQDHDRRYRELDKEKFVGFVKGKSIEPQERRGSRPRPLPPLRPLPVPSALPTTAILLRDLTASTTEEMVKEAVARFYPGQVSLFPSAEEEDWGGIGERVGRGGGRGRRKRKEDAVCSGGVLLHRPHPSVDGGAWRRRRRRRRTGK